MEMSRKLFSLIMWCSVVSQKTVNSQGYYYKQSNMNAYQLINGKFQPLTTTTPPPGLLETIFPWAGNGYDSVRSPEEDAAILNSLSDNDIVVASAAPTTMDGILAWLPIPAMPSMSGFSFPTFLPNTSGESPLQAAQSMQFSNEMLPNPNLPLNPTANMNFHDIPLMGAPSQVQPVIVSAPGLEGQVPIQFIPGQQPQPTQQQFAIPSQDQIPEEIRSNLNPTFQFHQQMKDAIPIPSPAIAGIGQPMMFPYPYSAPATPDFMKSGPEKTASFLDSLSNYFTFGKRSDLENILNQVKIIDARSSMDGQVRADDETEEEKEEEEEDDAEDSGYNFDFEATREALDGKKDKDFKCPKSGIWRWNGEVCIAVGPVPVWACRPNDLLVSGKIAICRNKIYFAPKVIDNHNFQE